MKIVRKYYKINESDQDHQKSMKTAGPRPKVEVLAMRRAMRQRTPGRRSAAEKYIIRCQIKQTGEKTMTPEE